MSGGIDEAIDRSGAEDRRIVAAARSMSDPHLIDRQFLDRGHRPPGRFEQGQHAAGGERHIVSFFFDGRPHEQAAVRARHQIGARRPDHVGQERRGRIHAKRQHLAFDRAHRRPQFGCKPVDAARPCSGGKHDHIGRNLASVSENDAVDTPAAFEIVLTAWCSLMLAPAASAAMRKAAASLRLSTWVSSGLNTAPASLPARCGSRRRVSAAEIHCSGSPSFCWNTS